jgi:Zn-dependent protease
MEYLLYGGGFLIFTVLALRVHRVVLILSFPLRTPEVIGIPIESVPHDIRAALAPGASELRRLGFEFSHFMTVAPMNAGIQSPGHASVFYHPEFDCYADLNASLTPDRAFPYTANFYSFYEDGLLYLTTNQEASSVIEGSPSLIAEDAFALTLSEQLVAHCEGVGRYEAGGDRAARTPRLDPAKFESTLNTNFADYTTFLCEQGWAHPEESHIRFGLRAAVHLAGRILAGEKRVKVMQNIAAKENAARHLPLSDEEMITLEVDAYQRHDQIRDNSRLNRGAKAALLIATILLFGAVFGITWSLDSLLILVGVVLFHELGHILAMHLCGYRDLQILFIPFLGAAAMGKADNPKAWQKAFVSLMGPVPGLLVGTALLWQGEWVEIEWVLQLTMILLVVNFLNLLPIMPLDGGQLLNAVLFNHHPRWQFGFFVLSVALLMVWALLDGGPLLFIFAILMVGQVPSQYRNMQLSRDLLATDSGSKPPVDSLRRTFHTLSGGFTAPLAFVVKIPLARQLLERLDQARPSWREVTGSLLVYMLALMIPFSYLGKLTYDALTPYTVETDWEAEIASAADLPTQLEQYVAASYDYSAADDLEQALRYLERARETAESNRFYGEEYAQVLQAMTSMYQFGERDPEPLYLRLIEVQTQLDGKNSPAVAQAHYNYAYYLLSADGALQTAQRHNLDAMRVQRELEDNTALYLSLLLESQLAEALADLHDAEAALREAATLAMADEAGLGSSAVVQNQLADFYVRNDRLDEAAQELQAIFADPLLEEYQRDYAGRRAGWVHILRGHGSEARAVFDQIYESHENDEELPDILGEYQFFTDGSTYQHTLLTAVSYWADGDIDSAAAELARGDALSEGQFMEDLRDYAELLRSMREGAEPGIDSRSYDLILAMLDLLDAGDTDQQVATALDAGR